MIYQLRKLLESRQYSDITLKITELPGYQPQQQPSRQPGRLRQPRRW